MLGTKNNIQWVSFLSSLTLFLFLACFSCNKSETEDIDLDFGYEYFPLEIGKYWVYSVDSVIYDPSIGGTAIDTIYSFIREELKDTLRDNLGDLLYRVEKYHRKNDTLPWQIQSAFTLSTNERQAFRTEENLKFIKMVFPATENKRWNGNAFIDEGLIIPIAGENMEVFKGWESVILAKENPYDLDNLNFPDVLELSIADNENLIEYRFGREVYAANVGLIYRELKILDTQCQTCCNGDFGVCESVAWEAKAEKGFIIRQRLIDFN